MVTGHIELAKFKVEPGERERGRLTVTAVQKN
jgi:hypothetical protein